MACSRGMEVLANTNHPFPQPLSELFNYLVKETQ